MDLVNIKEKDNKKCMNIVNDVWFSNDDKFFNSKYRSKKYSWRAQFIDALPYDKINKNGDIYQVGVFSGSSIKLVSKLFSDKKIKFNNIIGFDSFRGLPDEINDPLNCKSWYEGKFSLINDKIDMETIKNNIKKLVNYDKLILIDGFFCDTMNKNNVKKYNMNPAIYIDMDCDIYSSTVEALYFFYDNQLLQIGTIIGYDDWAMGDVDKFEYIAGQSRAHKEFCEKYNIKFERLDNYKLWKERAVFIVSEINY